MAKKKRDDGKPGKPVDRVRETIDWCLNQLSEYSPAVVILMERTAAELAENGPMTPRIEYRCGPASAGGVLAMAYDEWCEMGMPVPEQDEDGDEEATK